MKKITISFLFVLCLSQISVAQEFSHSVIADDAHYMMLLDSRERLWYSNGEKIMMYNGKVQSFDIPVYKYANRLWEDGNGSIWGTSPDGIIRYADDEWKTFSYGADVPENAASVMIFKDNSERIYFFTETQPMYGAPKRAVCIWDNEKVTCITEDLPERINHVIDYKDGVVFGDKRHTKPCGHYNGSYQLVSDGAIYDFYNSWTGLFTSDATNLESPEMFEKYQTIKKAMLQNDTLLFVTDKKAVCYFNSSNSFQEWNIPADYQYFTDEYLFYLHYQNEAFYLVHADKGVLEVKSNAARVLNKKNELADNDVKWVFTDEQNQLVLMHPKKSSVLMNDKWVHFNKKTGYKLSDLEVRHQLKLAGKNYIMGYNISGMGKKNMMLIWDNDKWNSKEFKLKYRYLSSASPVVFQNMIWFSYHNGNNFKGLIYYNRKDFIKYPLGKKVKQNRVRDILYSENAMYVYTTLSQSGYIHKVIRKNKY